MSRVFARKGGRGRRGRGLHLIRRFAPPPPCRNCRSRAGRSLGPRTARLRKLRAADGNPQRRKPLWERRSSGVSETCRSAAGRVDTELATTSHWQRRHAIPLKGKAFSGEHRRAPAGVRRRTAGEQSSPLRIPDTLRERRPPERAAAFRVYLQSYAFFFRICRCCFIALKVSSLMSCSILQASAAATALSTPSAVRTSVIT